MDEAVWDPRDKWQGHVNLCPRSTSLKNDHTIQNHKLTHNENYSNPVTTRPHWILELRPKHTGGFQASV